MGWSRGGTGRTYFTVGWAVPSYPVPLCPTKVLGKAATQLNDGLASSPC